MAEITKPGGTKREETIIPAKGLKEEPGLQGLSNHQQGQGY